MSARMLAAFVSLLWFGAGGLTGCQPKIAVEAPTEPITINLNVKIEHEIRVKVDDDLDDLFAGNEDLFGGSE